MSKRFLIPLIILYLSILLYFLFFNLNIFLISLIMLPSDCFFPFGFLVFFRPPCTLVTMLLYHIFCDVCFAFNLPFPTVFYWLGKIVYTISSVFCKQFLLFSFVICSSSRLSIFSIDVFSRWKNSCSISFLIFVPLCFDSLAFNSVKSFFNYKKLFFTFSILFFCLWFKYFISVCSLL